MISLVIGNGGKSNEHLLELVISDVLLFGMNVILQFVVASSNFCALSLHKIGFEMIFNDRKNVGNSKTPLIHVLIISYKGKDYVLRLLESVYRSTYPNFIPVLVDNNSGDGTVEEVRSRFPGSRIIENKTNAGFGSGCNVGIRYSMAAEADFVLVLNQDTVIHKAMLHSLASFTCSHPRAACIGPKTYFFEPELEKSRRILYAGTWRRWLPLQQKVRGIDKIDNGQYNDPCLVDYVWGHGMFLRIEALRQVGVFDASLFMYYEDLDLCIRLKQAGYEIWYDPDSVMWHEIPDGARASVSELWRWRMKTNSLHLVHRKHYGIVKGFILDVVFFLEEMFQLLRSGYWIAARHRFLLFFQRLFYC